MAVAAPLLVDLLKDTESNVTKLEGHFSHLLHTNS